MNIDSAALIAAGVFNSAVTQGLKELIPTVVLKWTGVPMLTNMGAYILLINILVGMLEYWLFFFDSTTMQAVDILVGGYLITGAAAASYAGATAVNKNGNSADLNSVKKEP